MILQIVSECTNELLFYSHSWQVNNHLTLIIDNGDTGNWNDPSWQKYSNELLFYSCIRGKKNMTYNRLR
ncbi:MAG: hypothetical protein IPN88_04720 [Bacteroidetes bacterium]|nr:hypothetical protein [Bacteroidota bacterium]